MDISSRKEKVIKVTVPKTKYRRYRVDESGRKIFIDFRCIRNTPFYSVNYENRRRIKWNSVEHLQGLIDEYFASCYGVIYNPKTGLPFYDTEGRPRIGQIKPFTLSGLALYLHVAPSMFRKYMSEDVNELGYPTPADYRGPQYSDIINEARWRIEAFAEENLYDKDSFMGGKFVLDAAFGWTGRKEQAEIDTMIRQTDLRRREFEWKKETVAAAESDEDKSIVVNIVRNQKDV